jgi:PilZ domain
MSEGETSEAQGEEEEEDEEESPSERRVDPRHLACFPAHVETATGAARSALIRDLSVSGALLLTRARLGVGDTVKLSLYLREGAPPYAVTARVVREEQRPNEMVHPWTKSVAVQFDAPIAELDEEARALADRQAALSGRRPGT